MQNKTHINYKEMKILVLNCGSSSIKYKLYDMDNESVLAQGGVERIGIDGAFIKVTLPNGEKKQIMHDMPDHKEGVNMVFSVLLDKEIGAISSLSEIDAVGNRGTLRPCTRSQCRTSQGSARC